MRIDVGAVSTCSFVSATSRRLAGQSVSTTEIGEIQHLPAAKPSGGVYRKVADGPCLIVEIELIYSSKLAVCSSDHKTFQMRNIR